MTCEEMIYSNEYVDYMINYFDGIEGEGTLYEGACVNPIMERIAILHTPKTTDYLTNLERTPYSFVPKVFGLMDSSNLEAVGVKQVKNAGIISDGAENVIVGVVDTGIDYQNSLFRNADGSTRINVIWDQTIESTRNLSDGFGKSDDIPAPYFGSAYAKDDIDRALQSDNPYEIVPSQDENGHGTFLTGVAAGGIDTENDFQGIASGAQIVVVKLKEAKSYLREYFGIKDGVPAYAETDIIYAVDYLLRYADEKNMPISILIGVGSSNGGHLGFTFLERYLSNILGNPGIMVSVPAGNEGNEGLHYLGSVNGLVDYGNLLNAGVMPQTVEINVAANQSALTLEFWGRAPVTYAIGLVSPQGDRIERIPPRFGQEEEIMLPLANTRVYVAYQLVETYSGDELIFVRLQNPTPGLWQMIVYAQPEERMEYNIWMPLRQFLQSDTYFLQANPNNTIVVPGNTASVSTMAAYNHVNGSIYSEGSRGYEGRDFAKPDLAAPGVDVTGPGLRNNYVIRTGTSVAAAHAAGIYALFLEWNLENQEIPLFYAAQIQSLFLKSAVRETEVSYPNVIWGYGIINLAQVFEQFRIIDVG